MKDLEFLPEKYLRAQSHLRLRFVRLWLLVVLALAMVCWTLYARSANTLLESKIAATESSLAGIEVGLRRVADQNGELQKFRSQRLLVDEVKCAEPRTLLLREIAARLPDQIFLSRLELVTERHEIPAVAAGGKSDPKPARTEMIDRLRIEGFAADDLALARFLQGLGDSGVFQKGELAFSKDAQIDDRSVRTFAATFNVTPQNQKKLAAGLPQGGQL
jgi:Tfp pilus assembly protein PilN